MTKLSEDLQLKVTEIEQLKTEVETYRQSKTDLDSDLKSRVAEIEKLKTDVETQKKKNNVSTV